MKKFNYIHHMNAVLFQFSKDNRLNPTHISLYIALFQLWNKYHFPHEFFVNRQEVMVLAKLGSKMTYHRAIKELSHWKYIIYMPSKNRFKGSQIIMFQFGTRSGQDVDCIGTKSGTRSGQEVVRKIKHKQTGINNKNNNKQENFNFENFSGENSRNGSVLFEDNLKTKTNKKYDEPL
ncbi:hypothetical protein NO995_11085 [Aestuariibaculum sp. M13]|uniref:hypothetical protein n=1 Tax=Aestuariibaculum sp. M13 TaxID=2967132 RepID=UPI00215A042C|nr:hypothetical protein [Aestuariibaculum sp. M13]MCR8668230.1 hypothetical protein [Aestuariibaculum sp. M13]